MHTGKQIHFAHETILFFGIQLYRDKTIKTKTYWNSPQKPQHVLCQWPDRHVQGQCVYFKTPSLPISLGEKNGVLNVSLWLSSSPESLHLLNSNFFLTCLLVSVNSLLTVSSKKLYLQSTDVNVLCQRMGVSIFHKESRVPWPHKFLLCNLF